MGRLKGTAHMEAPSNGLLVKPCWYNHIKYASFILPFTVFIRPTHYLHFKYNNSNHFTLNQLNILVCNFLCGLPHCLLNVTKTLRWLQLCKMLETFSKSDAIFIFLKWACNFADNKPLQRETDRTSFMQCRSKVRFIGGAYQDCRRRELLWCSGACSPQGFELQGQPSESINFQQFFFVEDINK